MCQLEHRRLRLGIELRVHADGCDEAWEPAVPFEAGHTKDELAHQFVLVGRLEKLDVLHPGPHLRITIRRGAQLRASSDSTISANATSSSNGISMRVSVTFTVAPIIASSDLRARSASAGSIRGDFRGFVCAPAQRAARSVARTERPCATTFRASARRSS